MRTKRHRAMKQTKIEIIPMIDVMFFLLVFFILTTIGVIKLQGLNINLPKSTENQPAKPTKSEITIAINAREEVFVNETKVPPGEKLGPILTRILGTTDPQILKDKAVVISADENVQHGTVVRCIDEAREVNIVKFAIATTKDEGGQPVTTP